MEKIDYVFPFVDGNEAIWYKAYRTFCETHNLMHLLNQKERFRSWDLLRYYFRCIEENLPFINNIYMIVSNKEQVPAWLDTKKVKIILHKDIIPSKYLPTFCSPTIEMFIGNIPELSEKFIYGNDDTFVISKMSAEDFFTIDDKAKINLIEKNSSSVNSTFNKAVKNEYVMISKYYNRQNNKIYYCPEHGLMPMFLSSVKSAQEKFKNEINKNIKPYRTEKDINQYLYVYEMFFTGKLTNSNIKFKYIGTEKSLNSTVEIIKNKSVQCLCINDYAWPNFELAKTTLADAFYTAFSEKSKYELIDCRKPVIKKPKNNLDYYLYF